ncbi:coiled-coil domain-containing protein 12 [Ciona intestinalis]|nr:coiled-coil domain-containing protein 12 [Ciona intestinalis]|eukprot:XP_002132159.1 coiled-coil domain-containing protein 12 [Ciona intestinalis]
MMGDKNVGNLEEAARKRKERLKAMREQRMTGGEPPSKKSGKEELPKPELKLRNYNPVGDDLKEAVLANAEPEKVEDQITNQLESQAAEPTVQEEVDILKLAPRKPDWDLKRDIQSKLDRLERKTQRAIAEIIRERLKQSTKEDAAHFAEVPDEMKGDGYDSD